MQVRTELRKEKKSRRKPTYERNTTRLLSSSTRQESGKLLHLFQSLQTALRKHLETQDVDHRLASDKWQRTETCRTCSGCGRLTSDKTLRRYKWNWRGWMGLQPRGEGGDCLLGTCVMLAKRRHSEHDPRRTTMREMTDTLEASWPFSLFKIKAMKVCSAIFI